MKYCERVFEGIYCMPGGNVSLCSWTDAVIGNILEDDLENIWHGELAEKVRDSIKDGSFKYCRKTSCPYCENNTLSEINVYDLKSKKAKPLPTYYEIANDVVCNHSCPSCRDHVFIVDEEYKMKLKKGLEKLLPFINKAERISVNGAGELFANPLMMEMMEKLKPENPDFKIGVQTNGALFNKKNWERIKHLSRYPISVTVTPNSFVRETHAYLTGGHKDYEQVMDNLYFLKELRQKEFIRQYYISIVVQDRNFIELPAFAERCINDFEVDRVTVKPLYKWFYMSEELYWFKDLLNPNHPYHKEYLEILDHPILNHPKVYLWGARNLHEAKLHPAYKYKSLLIVAKELILMPDAAEKLTGIIKKRGNNRFIIYGDNELTYIICKILKDSDIKVEFILARDFHCGDDRPAGVKIKHLTDYIPSDKDIILISNYYDRKFIERDLSLKKFDGQLLDIQETVEAIKQQKGIYESGN